MYSLKIAATLLSNGDFQGSEDEKTNFRFKFEKFAQTKEVRFNGEEVTLLEFFQDPMGKLPWE
ncbi:hypothetical protein ACP2AV_05940 [Aliiroseovarius sp. PTFE2010]